MLNVCINEKKGIFIEGENKNFDISTQVTIPMWESHKGSQR